MGYPKKMRVIRGRNKGCVVLFTSEGVGAVIEKTENSWLQEGYHSSSWNMLFFEEIDNSYPKIMWVPETGPTVLFTEEGVGTVIENNKLGFNMVGSNSTDWIMSRFVDRPDKIRLSNDILHQKTLIIVDDPVMDDFEEDINDPEELPF